MSSFLPNQLNIAQATLEPQPTQVTSRCRFMELPPELRIRIYTFLLAKDKPLQLWPTANITEPVLLGVSKVVRREASPVYYKQNSFVLQTYLSELSKAARWLRLLSMRCGPRLFGGFRFEFINGRWSELRLISPLLDLVREGSLELDVARLDTGGTVDCIRPTSDAVPDSLFSFHVPAGMAYLQQALLGAVQVAIVARERGLTRQELNWEFEALQTEHLDRRANRQYAKRMRSK